MKIVHAPMEIGGQVGLFCKELGKFGHQAVGFNYFRAFQNYTENIMLTDQYELMKNFGEALNYFDLFHFHFNMTMIPGMDDLKLIQKAGKPIVMHHWGNDVRMLSMASLHNPYVRIVNAPKESDIKRRLSHVGEYVPIGIVQDHEVYEYVKPYYKEVCILPLAIDVVHSSPAYPDEHESCPLIIHAPTDPLFKGTERIEEAISKLKLEYPLRYIRVEKLAREEALALYRQADLIIDQILCGSYGLVAVEAMALGKPVVAFIREALIGTFPPELPLCNASPDTLYDVLRTLITSGALRKRKGIEGRKFAEHYHDIRVVGCQLLSIYNRL
ncbi:glycosyltransferase [Paenibacillus apis]|uniref:Glycosyltransferase n=1 Tax=Paenibacillus apis TaxID=1792174 RepID=A0A919Y7K5_9BACL|nr:hypothetical protein [Paenibacillus apis]GIO43537.1 hypothetical protein J41TS4_32950 [Paenibacillus apis]